MREIYYMDGLSDISMLEEEDVRLQGKLDELNEELAGSLNDDEDFKTAVRNLVKGGIIQAMALKEECTRRRFHLDKFRYELGIRISQLEEGMTAEIEEKLKGLTTEYDQKITAVENTVLGQIKTLEKLSAELDDTKAEIKTEKEARADAVSAVISELEILTATVGENEAQFRREVQALTDALSAEVSARETLSTRVDENEAIFIEEKNARVEKDAITSEAIRQLAATDEALTEAQMRALSALALSNDNRRRHLALAREELHAEITAEGEARAARDLELYAQIEDSRAMIDQEQKARADADNAEAQSREQLAVRLQENEAAIETERQARADADNAEAQSREQLAVRLQENEAAIETERQARTDADNAEAQSREQLAVKVQENSTAIETERTARIVADNAEIKAREALSATVDGQSASIQDIQQIIADEEGIRSEDIRTVTAGLEALTQAEIEGLVATAEFQENNRRNLALARETLKAQITEESEARASRELELLAQIDGNKALIHEEQAARADDVESVASDIRELTTKVDGHEASIETLNEVKNGVTARNYVHLDSNGYVTGFEQYNGGAGTSDFKVIADKFKIVSPGNTDAKDVFEYDSEAQMLKVKNITVDGATIKSGTIGGVKIADGAITTPKIGDGAVDTDKIADEAITAAKIHAGAITAGHIDVKAITGDKIADGAITAEKIHAGTITADKIVAGTITTDNIQANAISNIKAAELSKITLTTSELYNGGNVYLQKIPANTQILVMLNFTLYNPIAYDWDDESFHPAVCQSSPVKLYVRVSCNGSTWKNFSIDEYFSGTSSFYLSWLYSVSADMSALIFQATFRGQYEYSDGNWTQEAKIINGSLTAIALYR